MSYKTILVYADPTPGSRSRLEAAASIALQFEGTILGVAAAMLRPFTDPYGNPVISAMIAPEMEDRERRVAAELAEAEAAFAAWAAAANATGEWRAEPTFAVDLIIAGPTPADDTSDFRPADIGALLLRSGRPVLSVSPQAAWRGGERILIGWKDTRETRRAVADALPLLQAAGAVTLLEIVEPGSRSDNSLEAAAAYLGRHGVTVEGRSEPQRDGSVEAQLFRAAADGDVDLIVAGGYGHSRLGEWVFGGVTRAMVQDSPVPVLLAH
jgi:nucleotide-binding universal stress UspA family protein